MEVEGKEREVKEKKGKIEVKGRNDPPRREGIGEGGGSEGKGWERKKKAGFDAPPKSG